MNARIDHALDALYDLDRPRLACVDYMAAHGININAIVRHCGCPTVLPITLLPHRRFDLSDGHGAEVVEGCIIEARAADGAGVVDLVGWPTADPRDVRTLLGRVPILGLSQAFNASTYVFGYPLVVHRTPLDWLKAGCQGAAVVIPDLAVWTFIEIASIGGRIGASDQAHQRELKTYLSALFGTVKIVSPQPIGRAA